MNTATGKLTGPRILDGEFSERIYDEYMALFDANTHREAADEKMTSYREEAVTDVDREIFITAYALSLWETGRINAEVIEEVKEIAKLGAGAKMWMEKTGEKDSIARTKEIERLLEKIATKRLRPRIRKKQRRVSRFLFEIDDVVSFKTSDDVYHAAIVIGVNQFGTECTYRFVPIVYEGEKKPTIQNMLDSTLSGKMVQEENDRAYAALDWIVVEHKNLKEWATILEVIGNLRTKENFLRLSSLHEVKNLEEFEKTFLWKLKNVRGGGVKMSAVVA